MPGGCAPPDSMTNPTSERQTELWRGGVLVMIGCPKAWPGHDVDQPPKPVLHPATTITLTVFHTDAHRHTAAHTPAFSFQNSKTPQVFMPPGTSEMCSIVSCAVNPLLPHPLALKDVCGDLLSSAHEAAVMSEAQSPWGR